MINPAGKGFLYIKSSAKFFRPKTPAGALRAVEQGMLPPEAYVFKATSQKPLYEEPFDLEEIQRILSRRDIDLETLLLLISILYKLIESRESETALFAAESLNEIENRFTSRINSLRAKLEKKETAAVQRELGKTCYELAVITTENRTIKNFYLREAFSSFNKVTQTAGREREDFVYLVKICMRLKLFAQAESIIEQIEVLYGEEADAELLEAETEFYRKHFTKVIEIARNCRSGDFSGSELQIISFWKGQ